MHVCFVARCNATKMKYSLKLGTTRKVILLLIVGGAVLFYADKQYAQRLHDENLRKAEQFETLLDSHVPPGSSVAAVQEYLEGRQMKWSPSVSSYGNVIEIRIEVAAGESPEWYCGKESVGVIADFKDELLKDTQVAAWSFNCL